MNGEDSFIIPPSLFDEDEHFVWINTSFYEKNENKSKVHYFTKKLKSLFQLKGKNIHQA